MKHQMEVNSKRHTIYSHVGPKTNTVTTPQHGVYTTHYNVQGLQHKGRLNETGAKRLVFIRPSILCIYFTFYRLPAPHTPAK